MNVSIDLEILARVIKDTPTDNLSADAWRKCLTQNIAAEVRDTTEFHTRVFRDSAGR